MSGRSKSEKIVRDIKRHTRRKYTSEEKIRTVPGCETAFSARTSPFLNIRRGRIVARNNWQTRDLKYPVLRKALLDGGVYLIS